MIREFKAPRDIQFYKIYHPPYNDPLKTIDSFHLLKRLRHAGHKAPLSFHIGFQGPCFFAFIVAYSFCSDH